LKKRSAKEIEVILKSLSKSVKNDKKKLKKFV